MARSVRWLARMLGFGRGSDDDGVVSFEHVDGSRLSADEFHLSDSMRLGAAIVRDFSETLPSYSRRTLPPVRVPRMAAVPGHNAR